MGEQHREDGLGALLGHDLVEAGEALVRHPAAVLEARDDVVLDGGEARDPLRLDREVVGRGRTRKPGGVLRGQGEPSRFGIDLHDAPGRHRAEPLTDVPLVELGRVGELLARRLLVLREGVEQARAVAHGDHHRQRAAVQQFEHATREGFGALGVVRSLGHLHLLGPGL